MLIYHITSELEWQQALPKGEYTPANYAADGFIHCSKKEQVVAVANRVYPNQNGLILLQIDTKKLAVTVKEENLEGGKELFPHIYGALPTTAVVDSALFIRQPGNGFIFPGRLAH
jgi:uncharacterized protein (DUF952 family)